jgi:hypothetical protein
VATACSSPPAGRARWTLELLADEMVNLTGHESLSGETVRRHLADQPLPARARADRALRLRVPAQRDRQSVRVPRCEPPLAQGQGHRAPHRGGLRRLHARPHRCHYPKAERIRVVLDNLSTHSAGALYHTFPADEARRVLRRLEFHYLETKSVKLALATLRR